MIRPAPSALLSYLIAERYRRASIAKLALSLLLKIEVSPGEVAVKKIETIEVAREPGAVNGASRSENEAPSRVLSKYWPVLDGIAVRKIGNTEDTKGVLQNAPLTNASNCKSLRKEYATLCERVSQCSEVPPRHCLI